MQTHVRKFNLIIAATLLGCALITAQNPAPPGTTPERIEEKKHSPSSTSEFEKSDNVPPKNTANAPNEPKTTNENTPALDYLFNKKPKDGSAVKNAVDLTRRADDKAKAAEALGFGKQMNDESSQRFEQYLGTMEVAPTDLRNYAIEVERVMSLLRENKTFEAWKQLNRAAAYQTIDAGVSGELANRIESIWNTDKAKQRVQGNNNQLKKEIKTANYNADTLSKSIKKEDASNSRKAAAKPAGGGGGAPASQEMSGLEGKLQLTEQYLQSLEAKAKIKFNELKMEKLLDQAKGDFSQYIGTLYGSGRYLHVILAADFYRRIFNEGEYPVSIANQVNASLEIQRNVKSAIEVFRYKMTRNELAGATERLQSAFATSEFHPSVLSLERSFKEKIAVYTVNLLQMQNLIEARDFGTLVGKINETKAMASDFDTAKPLALVNAVKLESKMRMGKAKMAAQQGDQKTAMEEFQAAAEAWPGNPDLQDKALNFFESQDVISQSLVEFDRLFADANYRAIFEKQLAFAPAMKDDKKRQEQLKTSLETIKNAEVASEKANALIVAGDAFGAWETIEFACKDYPDDKKLNKLRADYSSRSAEFVSSVNKARDAEARSELGYSLTWYVNAQRQYPASRIANEAIERLSRKALESTKL